MERAGDGTEIKSTGCSCRSSGFDTQHPHGHSQPTVTPVPEEPTTASELFRHQAYMWHIDIHAGKTLTHIKEISGK